MEEEAELARIAEAKRRQNEDLGVTRKAYAKIRDGMAKREVQQVIGYGCFGEEQSSAGSLKVYAWQDGFRSIVATFRNDHLVAKAQFGL